MGLLFVNFLNGQNPDHKQLFGNPLFGNQSPLGLTYYDGQQGPSF